MSAAAIAGVFSDYKLVRTRSVVQIIVEVPVEQQADVFAALGYPMPGQEINVAVARLIPSAGKSTTPPQPTNQERTAAAEPDGRSPNQPVEGTHKDRRPWDELRPSQQAGILCSDVAFQQFASTHTGWNCDEEAAASWLRAELGINSRRELDLRSDLAPKLNDIRAEFMEWAGRVPVGAR